MVTDPIADMLTRIKNGIARKRSYVLVPYSKMIEQIAKLLKQKTIIDDYMLVETESASSKTKHKQVRIQLAYDIERGKKVSRIQDLRRMSKPGVRMYESYKELKPVLSGFGVAVISTSKGLMTDSEAKKEKVGGELLFEIW